MNLTTREQKRTINIFLFIAGTLIIIGLLFVYSSSFLFALEKHGSTYFFLQKQLIGLSIGLGAFFFIQLLPYNLIHQTTPLLFFISYILTALTLIPGWARSIHGATRWLEIGGFAFQPSEFLKVTFVLYCAYLLSKPYHPLARSSLTTVVPFLVLLASTCGLLLLQPDFGLAMTLVITLFALIFVVNGTVRHFVIALLMMIPVATLLIVFKPYRLRRILTFLNPWNDPQGAGFQIIQSLIAIGSGKWFGVGISQSKQKFFYLPMQHTDFIFSIIAEETGFIGSSIIVTLFMLLTYFGIKIARRLRDQFASYAVFGLVFLISIQAIINLAVATGLAPTKGTGLPFISYGKSSLISVLIIVALIVRFARSEMRQASFARTDIAL